MVKPDFDFPKIDLKSWILAQNLTNFLEASEMEKNLDFAVK